MKHILKLMSILAFMAMLTACAGVSMPGCASPSASDPDLAELQTKACAGDKRAQFHLAQRYESGDGVTLDMKLAVLWYTKAAADIRDTTSVYSAPVGSEKYGRVLTFDNGLKQAGYTPAQFRLAEIYFEGPGGIKRDPRRARKWAAETLLNKGVRGDCAWGDNSGPISAVSYCKPPHLTVAQWARAQEIFDLASAELGR